MDINSYVIGLRKGKEEGSGSVIIEGSEYEFTDAQDDGNIVITKESE